MFEFLRGKSRNALDTSELRVRDWQIVAGILVFVLVAHMVYSGARQNDITVHVPPDISNGATFKAGTIPKPNVYLFASEVWRSVNYWEKNGDVDMPANLQRYSCYMTEMAIHDQAALQDERSKSGQSRDRTRRLSDISDLKNIDAAVSNIGAGTWTVDLDVQLTEGLQGTVVKDQPLRYRVHVVADNSGSSCGNQFNMRVSKVEQPLTIKIQGEPVQ